MKAIQIPDRTRASLAPYLPIPYGGLKLAGMITSLVLFGIAQVAAHLWFPSYGWPTNLGILISSFFLIIFLLIAAVASRDVGGGWVTDWVKVYWDRNWRGYRLWVYKVGEEYKYWILHADRNLGRPDVKVAVRIPLTWPSAPFYWIKDTPFVPRPFHLQLKHYTFSGAWCVVVGDHFGNSLNLPVEMALELGLAQVQDTTELPCTAQHFSLANNFLNVCTEWKWRKESAERSGLRFVNSLRTIKDAISRIRATTRFQRSKDGQAIREFLELRYLMLTNNESEEDARKRMLESA